ncbi:hypothetical protein UR09_02380 [Candidatus Nitromaritima sp. SCGC AAA799-A02]|nr:hypothetical protein UZ36_03365 [Candidatus Nitromaritima sp. SCGC AAA799-C22]KMP11836.1 hypothetical protein UR09_02380 [Candidatus Nitromaritima sp. SCGC AAA799-A02]
MAKPKHTIPVRGGDKLELTVETQGSSGDGICRHEGYTLFVPGGLPGDRIFAEVTKTTPRFGVLRVIERRADSPDRVVPPCPVFNKCGGCKLQDLKYEKQVEFKAGVVADALKHIAGIDAPSIRSIPAERTYHYRNKGSFAVQKQSGFLRIGFFKQGSHEVVGTERCDILPDRVNLAKEWMRDILIKHRVSVYDEQKHSGFLRELVIRHSATSDEVLIGLITTEGTFPNEFLADIKSKNALDRLRVCGIVQNINPEKTNVILGKETRVLWGAGVLNEVLGDLKFRLSLTSFFQIHPEQTIRLYDTISEWTKGSTGRVLDAYCGVGAISLWLGKSGLSVVGIEESPQAVEDAKNSARLNGIDSCDFLNGTVEEYIGKFNGGCDVETVILDPPRKGCSEEVLKVVSAMAPQRIIYVSCNPSTLARDLGRLEGYRIGDLAVIDLFPQTQHVETAVLLVPADASNTENV